MTQLAFRVSDIRPEPYAVTPILLFELEIEESTGTPVHSLALRAQIRIEPQLRRYSESERAGLRALFGEDGRWGDTARTFLWAHAALVVPAFSGATKAVLPLACSYDLEVAAGQYLHALRDGSVPLRLLFNGTVFSRGAAGVAVAPVPWHHEATAELPVSVWRALMDQHFPDRGWLALPRSTLDALLRFKAERALATWEQVMDALLAEARGGPR